MSGMRVDHVSYAAEHDGLQATAQRLAKLIGVTPVDGGIHPRFGTRNVILPLAHERYVEVVEVLDHPASDKAPFGQAVRARSEAGGGWLGWCIAVDDLAPLETRIGREAVPGNRHRPDGVELRWRQLGIKGLMSDPQLPYFVQWEDAALHPSTAATTTGHHRQPADRRRPGPRPRLARPAARRDLLGHRLHLRRPARHPRTARRHLRHPDRQGHRLTPPPHPGPTGPGAPLTASSKNSVTSRFGARADQASVMTSASSARVTLPRSRSRSSTAL